MSFVFLQFNGENRRLFVHFERGWPGSICLFCCQFTRFSCCWSCCKMSRMVWDLKLFFISYSAKTMTVRGGLIWENFIICGTCSLGVQNRWVSLRGYRIGGFHSILLRRTTLGGQLYTYCRFVPCESEQILSNCVYILLNIRSTPVISS